jgi:signal transduction histidine kinase
MPSMFLDRMSMLRVFRNLVDNALKYGGESLSEITIGYRQEDNFHLISVSDNGRGFKDENGERIFALFGRQENSRGIEGTGLGLAIVREIVEKHQGWVWAESGKPSSGAHFYIALPKELDKGSAGEKST